MNIKTAFDWYAMGYRYVQAKEVEVGDDYLLSYVETVIDVNCMERIDYHNGYISLDGNQMWEDQYLWVRKR